MTGDTRRREAARKLEEAEAARWAEWSRLAQQKEQKKQEHESNPNSNDEEAERRRAMNRAERALSAEIAWARGKPPVKSRRVPRTIFWTGWVLVGLLLVVALSFSTVHSYMSQTLHISVRDE
jgi:hypothetical protein